MKIYFFGADYPPTGGGITTYTYEWLQVVTKQSKISEVRVLMFGNKNPRSESLDSKTTVQTLSGVNFFVVGFETFFKFWNSKEYDVFHSFNLFPVGFWITFWSIIFRKKSVVTFYGTDANDSSAKKITLIMKKWTLKNASLPFTISEFTRHITEKKYKLLPNTIKVIYPVVPKVLLSKAQNDNSNQIDKINVMYGIDDKTFVILSVARLVKRKGIEFTVKALKEINDKNIKFFIIGEGKEKENLTKLVRDLKLDNNVFILGRVDDIVPFYKIAHASTLVSYEISEDGDFEGLGLALVEAQSYNVPVIGSESGGIPEAFEKNRTGILIKSGDITGLGQAILKIKSDKAFAKSLSDNSSNFLEERFGIKNTVLKYIELCSTL